ncbi:MAG: tetratricopeptide repeat protein [Microbacteriaceae bacterium]|nr:MAG: tetratricopeptide repeat protein [Microbacteriaceae bacterium]
MSDAMPPAAGLRGAVDLSSLVSSSTAAAATDGEVAPGEATMLPGLVFDGTDANFSQFLDLSTTIPVIVDLWATWCEPCKQLSPILDRLVREYDGRFVLVKVDVDVNPQLSQAFQAQSIPTVAALIGGRPVALFTGAIPEAQVREVFAQVLQLAQQNGVTGQAQVDTADAADTPGEPDEPAVEPLPPLHQEAYDAIERGDYDAAAAAYRTAIAQNPRDHDAVAGLAQVGLLGRLNGRTLDEIRDAAASQPHDVDSQLAVADLDLSGGHVEDAFDRLLTLYPALDAAGKNIVRERLLDFFEIVGIADPRVSQARARLSALLY